MHVGHDSCIIWAVFLFVARYPFQVGRKGSESQKPLRANWVGGLIILVFIGFRQSQLVSNIRGLVMFS